MHCQALQTQGSVSVGSVGAGTNGGLPLSAARLAAEVQALADAVPIPPALQVRVWCFFGALFSRLYGIGCTCQIHCLDFCKHGGRESPCT